MSDELLWAVSAPSARLGILGQTESENGYTGVRILDFDGDPLPHAATVLQKGDLILRIDTQAIKTTTELRQALQEKKPKQSVSVTVLRLGQELTFDVMLEK